MKHKIYLAAAWLAVVCAGLFANSVVAADAIRLCTGASDGAYYAGGQKIANMAGATLPIDVVDSAGTIDNMERMVDKNPADPFACDAIIGQPDGPAFWARTLPTKAGKFRQIGSLHREYLFLFCNKTSDIYNLSKLIGKNGVSIAIGPAGSGGWLVWQNIVSSDKRYNDIPTTPDSGILALQAVASGEITCMVRPASIKDPTVVAAANDENLKKKVVLAEADDSAFFKVKDFKGETLYEKQDIPVDGVLKPFAYSWSGITTLSWYAGLYANPDRFQRFKDTATLSKLATAATRAAANIRSEYGK
jgi:uncharacterized protein